MHRFSFLFVLPLLAATAGGCAAPSDQAESGDDEATLSDALTQGSTYVRITGTCFQSYEMKAINTGVKLGASELVFKPGQEGKQFAFCAGTDRVVLRGAKTADGKFAVDSVWMQQTGTTLGENAEIVRALKRANGESFELALNSDAVRRVSFDLGANTLSTTGARQLSTGRILFAGPRTATSNGGGGGGGYGRPAPAANGARRVDAVFQEME